MISYHFHKTEQKILMNHVQTNKIIYWVMDGTDIGPYLPPPHPHPRCGKSLLPGNRIFLKTLFDKFFIKKKQYVIKESCNNK